MPSQTQEDFDDECSACDFEEEPEHGLDDLAVEYAWACDSPPPHALYEEEAKDDVPLNSTHLTRNMLQRLVRQMPMSVEANRHAEQLIRKCKLHKLCDPTPQQVLAIVEALPEIFPTAARIPVERMKDMINLGSNGCTTRELRNWRECASLYVNRMRLEHSWRH